MKKRRGAQNMIISIQSANTNGAPMSPAPIVMADQTQKKSVKHNFYIIGAQCLVSIAYLLAEGDICTPISTSVNSSVRLTYFHTNRLLNELYKQETEIRWRKDEGYIKK